MTNRKQMGVSGRAAVRIDEQVHRGAEAISQMAHRAADQLDRASGYIHKQSEWTREYVARASELAGFGVGFALRGQWGEDGPLKWSAK